MIRKYNCFGTWEASLKLSIDYQEEKHLLEDMCIRLTIGGIQVDPTCVVKFAAAVCDTTVSFCKFRAIIHDHPQLEKSLLGKTKQK